MKKIAIITSGILPVPAVMGGAVENLIDFYLEENEKSEQYDITVYSVYHPDVELQIKYKKHTKYYFVHDKTLCYRIKRFLYRKFHKSFCYNYQLDYFLACILPHIKNSSYEAIIFENRPGFAPCISNVTNAKLILHLHCDPISYKIAGEKEAYQVIDKVIAVSDYVKARTHQILKNVNVSTVYNGIDLSKFTKTKENRLRLQLGFEKHDFVIVYSGRLIPEKGVKELIEAMYQLKTYKNIKLLIIGDSFFGNASSNKDFVNQLRESTIPLQNRIIFTGFVAYKDIPTYLSVSDIAIVPSICEEAFGLTVIEAMAAGLPVIATKSGGIPEITNEKCCLLVERDNLATHLSDMILYCYNNPILLRKMSQDAFANAQRFSKERYAKCFFDVINNLINRCL